MWELDHKQGWVPKNWCFQKLRCWRRLLRVPCTARRSNQSILKEIKPEYSLEGLMLKLKLQYFGHLMQRAHSLEKTLMLGKMKAGEGDNRGWDGWMASPTQWTRVWANSRRWWRTGKPGMLHSMGVTKSWTQLSSWTTTVRSLGSNRCRKFASANNKKHILIKRTWISSRINYMWGYKTGLHKY